MVYFVVLMLAVTLAAPLTILPDANAHTPPWTIPTYAYIGISPNPIGVGQTALIQFGIDPIPPTANATGGDRWANMIIRVTKPDGTTESKGPYTSNATGQAHDIYTPTMTGTYTFVFSFPGQILSRSNPMNGLLGVDSEYVNDTYLPSSAQTTLRVQQVPVESTTPTPSASPQPSTVQTTASVFVQPNPVGVGQTLSITMSIAPPSVSGIFDGLVLTITKPDGTIENVGPFYSNLTGFVVREYTPTMVGTYFLQLMYPGQFFAGSNTTYLPSSSNRAEFRVQQQPVTTGTPSPMPTVTLTPTPTHLPSSPTQTPTYPPASEPTGTQIPIETASPSTTVAPSLTDLDSPSPTKDIVMQEDKLTPQSLYLSPVTAGAVAVVITIVVVVAVLLRRLFDDAGKQTC